MKNILKAIKKAGIALAGGVVVIIGIILLPLPGPGMLVIMVGLLILSTEFDWAQRYLQIAKAKLKKIYEKAKKNKN